MMMHRNFVMDLFFYFRCVIFTYSFLVQPRSQPLWLYLWKFFINKCLRKESIIQSWKLEVN